MPIIEGAIGTPFQVAGTPSAGTDAVQTLTVTATGGTYTLSYEGFTTTALAFDALAATIDAALEALPSIGASGVAVTSTGPWTITFGGNLTKKLVSVITVGVAALTGGSASIANTTHGVDATARGAGKGCLVQDTTNGLLYINTGTARAPTWTKVGVQT